MNWHFTWHAWVPNSATFLISVIFHPTLNQILPFPVGWKYDMKRSPWWIVCVFSIFLIVPENWLLVFKLCSILEAYTSRFFSACTGIMTESNYACAENSTVQMMISRIMKDRIHCATLIANKSTPGKFGRCGYWPLSLLPGLWSCLFGRSFAGTAERF